MLPSELVYKFCFAQIDISIEKLVCLNKAAGLPPCAFF